MEKAFDTVNYSILLHKLKYYTVRGIANNSFKFFSKIDTNIQILNNVALKNS